jgi:hypothetical protein
MSEEKKVSIDQQCINAARAGDVALAKELHRKGANINCVLMGGSDCENKAQRKELCEFACNQGASLLFAFTQERQQMCGAGGEAGNSFFTRVQMLKGPGEAVKGTFSHLKT